eukprot:IDg19766t1
MTLKNSVNILPEHAVALELSARKFHGMSSLLGIAGERSRFVLRDSCMKSWIVEAYHRIMTLLAEFACTYASSNSTEKAQHAAEVVQLLPVEAATIYALCTTSELL